MRFEGVSGCESRRYPLGVSRGVRVNRMGVSRYLTVRCEPMLLVEDESACESQHSSPGVS